MHIVILIGRFPPGVLGGAERQAEGWAERLCDRHRVTVVTRQEPGGYAGPEPRPGYTLLRLRRSGIALWRSYADLRAIERTVRGLEPRPDLLLCFQTFISGFAGVSLQKRLGIPAVVWIRGEGEYRLERSLRWRMIAPRVWAEATGVLVQTEEAREQLLSEIRRHRPAALERVASHLGVVPNGIEMTPDGESDVSSNRVLAVGRLVHEKGIDTVIDAMEGAGRPLTVAGVGPEREQLQQRALARGVEARFEGLVAASRMRALYRESACTVLAARFGEGLPNALIEAMSLARPVIGTPVTGIRELIQDGVNGLLVPPDDPRSLRAAIDRLAGDRALARRLGAEARRSVERFEWSRVRPRLEEMLERWSSRERA
ncbi:MAG TPA: glycosyltransferase family 4 protein [Candidatus Udaeobacter sp.]|jgi:glycosyltransferase involved in cell wall biosynthesis|nr:glycosyltransferase family 4 protein [Candidatus Udaeobacter sp.]